MESIYESSPLKIMVVEDNEGDRGLILEALGEATGRHQSTCASTLGEALLLLDQYPTDVIVLDLGLPDSQGLDTFRRLQQHAPNIPVVVMTMLGDHQTALATIRAGAQDYFIKGYTSRELIVRSLQNAVERLRLIVQMDHSRAAHERDMARSLAIIDRQNKELMEMADRAHHAVDDVSHEFRTPLAVIKEFASIITDGLAGPVSAKQAEYLKIMDGAVIELNHMVEDLLDSSKLRAGRLRVDRREHRIADIFAKGKVALERKAATRMIMIESRVEDDLPPVFADEEKVRRVISNLITNAIKFSPESGRILLAASRSTRPAEIVISVTDQGPGLSATDIDRLFNRFQQAATARNVSAKGFGLGLSIAQELAWLNLGCVSVQSEKGKGATFSFTLPVYDCDAVIRRYFETLVNHDRPGEELALVRIEIGEISGECGLEEPRAFLASATYPTDLILPADHSESNSGGTHGSLWVLGRTKSATAWTTRLRAARAEMRADSACNLADLDIDLHETWMLPNQYAEIAERIIHAVHSNLLRVA